MIYTFFVSCYLVSCIFRFSDRFALLHTLCKGSEVGRCNLHGLEFARCRIKDALLHHIHLPVAACGTEGVASCVSKRSLFAGFGADACHSRGTLPTIPHFVK